MKFKRIILLSLALLILLSSMLMFTSCGTAEQQGCKDEFIDANSDGFCDKCKSREHPCTEYGEEHKSINAGKCDKT